MKVETLLYILTILQALLYLFLRSYISAKGKNMAQKEDVEELTEKVEAVRTSFIQETERLKARLELSNQLQISHLDQRRSAVVNHYKALIEWINIILDVGLYSSGGFGDKEVKGRMEKIDSAFSRLNNSEALMMLLVDNKELISSGKQLKANALENLSAPTKTHLRTLEKLALENRVLDYKPTTEDTEGHKKLLSKQRREELSSFPKQLLKNYETAWDELYRYTEQAQKYLEQIGSKSN